MTTWVNILSCWVPDPHESVCIRCIGVHEDNMDIEYIYIGFIWDEDWYIDLPQNDEFHEPDRMKINPEFLKVTHWTLLPNFIS